VIDGGVWSQDRVMRDAACAWKSGQAPEVRRPDAVRRWQRMLGVTCRLPSLAEALWVQSVLAGANKFGPDRSGTVTVRDLIELARAAFRGGKVVTAAKDRDAQRLCETDIIDLEKRARRAKDQPAVDMKRAG
jgi:CDP-glucose 4,6-dehydratase